MTDLPLLGPTISQPIGVLWLTAALLSLAVTAALLLAPLWWVGALAVVTSQVASWNNRTVLRWGDHWPRPCAGDDHGLSANRPGTVVPSIVGSTIVLLSSQHLTCGRGYGQRSLLPSPLVGKCHTTAVFEK